MPLNPKARKFFQWASNNPAQAALEGKSVKTDKMAEPTPKSLKAPKVPVKSFGMKVPTVGRVKRYYGEK